MVTVGTVKIKVEPELDGFAEAIRAEVQRIVHEELVAFADASYRRGVCNEEEDVD